MRALLKWGCNALIPPPRRRQSNGIEKNIRLPEDVLACSLPYAISNVSAKLPPRYATMNVPLVKKGPCD